MESAEIKAPLVPRQEGEHIILGRYSLETEGKEASTFQNVLIVQSEEGAEHPFYAIDEKTEEDVPLTITKIIDVYRNVLQRDPPPKYLHGPNQYWKIRGRKRRDKQRKSIPVETPIEH